MATTISDLLDAQIEFKNNGIAMLEQEIQLLVAKKIEYGDDIVIEKWQQFKTLNGLTRVMITNLDKFPSVGIRFLEAEGVSPSDLASSSVIPKFVDYTTFKESFPLFVESIRQ